MRVHPQPAGFVGWRQQPRKAGKGCGIEGQQGQFDDECDGLSHGGLRLACGLVPCFFNDMVDSVHMCMENQIYHHNTHVYGLI